MFEEPEIRKPKRRELGADLATLSVQDLKDYIAELEAEIERVRADLARKDHARGGAEALFRRG